MAEEEFQEQSSVKTETEKEQSAVEKKKAKEQSATEKENVNVENVMEQEQVEDPVIIESEDVKMETEPDYMQMEVKNPRIGKVLKLEEEAKRQNELEQLRSKRIRQQQEYINAADADVLKEYLPLPKALAVRDKQPPLVHCKYPQSRKAHYRLAVLGYHRDHTLLFHFCLRKFVRINVCGLRNAAANIGR